MGQGMKFGPVSALERQAYLARLGSDQKCGRPTEKTAREVWALLADTLPVQLEDLMAKSKAEPSTEEYDRRILVAKQSLVIALDCTITVAGTRYKTRMGEWREKMLTRNLLFDALALRWSRSFRHARQSGARTAYDMRLNTVKATERELLVAGVRFDTLWHIVTGPWSRLGLNPLFSVTRVHGNDNHLRGYRVTLRDSDALQAFETSVEGDGQYRRREPQRRLLLAEDRKRTMRQVRQKFCEEQPYNVVNLGEESERLLTILEQSRVKFNVEVFRDDYETLRRYLKYNRGEPYTQAQRREYRKLRGFVSAYRRVYRQTEGIPLETYEYWDEGGGRPTPMSGYRWIKSRFRRDVNRRYGAINFWPENVPKDFRDRWFDAEVFSPATEEIIPYDPDEVERVIREGGPAHGQWIERDIMVSQIQTLAVFLGLDTLEALATSKNPTLKEWLSDRLWASGLLATGYDGPGDPRLVAFGKKHLMHFYGADLSKIIRECGSDEAEYGPGWKTTRGLKAKPILKSGTKTVVIAKSGIAEAEDNAFTFFTTLPGWIHVLHRFLETCQRLAQVDAARTQGVVFSDPFDHAEVRWHHAQRGTRKIGHDEIEVRPAGHNPAHTNYKFMPLPQGTVDQAELRRFIAPCLTHMLDAFLSSLVVKNLADVGVTNIVELHDAWLVPETVTVALGDKTFIDEGADVLEDIITEAGRPWLEGLGPVYDRLIYYLGNNPEYGEFVHGIKDKWEERVKAQRWPRFTTK